MTDSTSSADSTEVAFSDFRRTAFVTIDPEGPHATRDPQAPHGNHAAQARQFWSLDTAYNKGYGPVRLVAVAKGSHEVLGDWDLVEADPLVNSPEDGRQYSTFNLVDANLDDPRGIKGRTLAGFRGTQNGVSWSQDISKIQGLKGQG